MLKTIIVAVDFSPVSLNSVHYAKNLALALDASLLLFHTYGQPLTFSEIPAETATINELSYSSNVRLEKLKSSIRHLASDRLVIYSESRFGDVVGELMSLCKRLNPLAVVMSTTGHGSIHDLFIGSNTVEAIRRINIPIIVIPPGCTFRVPKKIGLACDMRDIVKHMPASTIRELIGWFNSVLHIMNVRISSSEGAVVRNIETLLSATMFSDLNPQFHFPIGKNVPETLNRFAEEENLDWIILIPKKHGVKEGLFRNSVSKRVAYQTRIPIVCVHS